MNSQLSYVICMLLADDANLTQARDPIWLVGAINNADFGQGRRIRLLCITGDVGMQILIAGSDGCRYIQQ